MTTTNLKITLNEIKDLKATETSSGSTLTLTLASPLQAWNNGAIGNGKVDLTREKFPIDDYFFNNVDGQEIKQVEISVSEEKNILSVFIQYAIFLKAQIKNQGMGAQNRLDDTLIEEGSTGQKQLANINQTLEQKKDAQIFCFDEADNALDQDNQKQIQEKIRELSKVKIVVYIKH
jgi:ABC-type phosphate transport system ATPase subunit